MNTINVIFIIISLVLVSLAYFYRSPKGCMCYSDNLIISPAYGRVMNIFNINDDYVHIAIFLSPLDVHTQYFPMTGQIKDVYKDDVGKFELAYNENKSRYNEKVITSINTKYGLIYVYQIAGFFVRRIEPYCKEGDNIHSGQKMGRIHFGSRVDLILPRQSELYIKKGDYVEGGKMVIGKLI